jgi:putative transcriptional regulator
MWLVVGSSVVSSRGIAGSHAGRLAWLFSCFEAGRFVFDYGYIIVALGYLVNRFVSAHGNIFSLCRYGVIDIGYGSAYNAVMIRSRLGLLIAEKEHRDGRKWPYREIARVTALSTGSLVRLSRSDIKGVDIDTLDRICRFFECDVAGVLEYVPSAE